MLTGVYTRRKELAVMESVGMTKNQIRKTLMLEGLYYCVITAGLILSLGSTAVFGVGKLTLMMADYAVFSYPTGLLLAILAVILVVCMTVPPIVYRIVSKESITNRLGIAE
jgi:putative ABC transport system permease protein